MFTLGWVTSNADADYSLYALFHSKQVPPTGWNTSRYANPEVDTLVEQARRSLNQSEREKLYGEAQDILAKEMVWIPVYNDQGDRGHPGQREGLHRAPGRVQPLAGEGLARQVAPGLAAMLTFLVRRLLLAVPVLLGVVFVVMLTVELIPGDAVALMLGEHATPEAVAKLRDYLGLDKPLVVRYVEYVGRVARGDLGRSIQQNRPVVDELARRVAGHPRAHGGGARDRGRGRACSPASSRRCGRTRASTRSPASARSSGSPCRCSGRAWSSSWSSRFWLSVAPGGRHGLARPTSCCPR